MSTSLCDNPIIVISGDLELIESVCKDTDIKGVAGVSCDFVKNRLGSIDRNRSAIWPLNVVGPARPEVSY